MPAGAVVCCVIGGGVHLIRDMAGNAGDANPDPNSEEGGCPAHNTTLDGLDGRLPGADHMGDKGQALREPGGDQLTGTDSRNRETHRDACGPWVIKVLERALAVRHLLDDQQTTLTTTVCGGCRAETPGSCLSSKQQPFIPPPALGAEGAVSRAGFCGAASTDAPLGASCAVRSASQPSGAEFCAQLPAVAGGLSSNNNISPNTPPPPALGAEGADSRAGFCGAAPTGASHGASAAVRSASQPSGAEFGALLPAVAGGLSSNNNISSNTSPPPQHLVLRELIRAQVSAAQLPLALLMERLLLYVQHPNLGRRVLRPAACCSWWPFIQ